ncbi:MAG: HAD-IA family hydrolase, partial [Proteobacteria bacterium]|nr:HAD-IA family hydrolase [Pseudomonadota bacterium]
EKKVASLQLQHHVRFINNFLPLHNLLEYLQLTDIYLFTSNNPNQAVSGTFSYAVSCGCPIISTPIPHSREVLKDDAGIIFDFDGVIVDSLSVHLTAWEAAYQLIYHTPLEDTTGLAGRATGAIAKILAERAGQGHSALELAEAKRSQLKMSRHLIAAMPGALDAFIWLQEQRIPYGIASNAPRAFIEQTLAALNAKVPIVFGVDDVPLPKPAPDMFLMCARAMGVNFTEHSRTVVFEDSTHGLKAAVRAGMFPVGVETQHGPDILLASGAKTTCLHIKDAMEKGLLVDI